jgi:hypothetical protein
MPPPRRLVVASLLLSACASRQWLRAETPRLVVYSEVDEAATRDAVSTIEGFDRFFHWATQCDRNAGDRLKVYLVDSTSEFQRTWPDSIHTSCFAAAQGETFAMAIREKTSEEDRTSLFALLHAVAPHFQGCAPFWLTEALAEYYGETVIEAAGNPHIVYSNSRADVLHEQSWLELEALLGKTVLEDSDVPLFDAQAWLLLRYFRSEPERRAKLASYLQAVRDGQDTVAALGAAALNAAELRAGVERYFARNVDFNPYYAASVRPIADGDEEAIEAHRSQEKLPSAPIELTRLPSAEGEHLLEDRRAKLGGAVPRCQPDRSQL